MHRQREQRNGEAAAASHRSNITPGPRIILARIGRHQAPRALTLRHARR
jgi:hypothetical protein